MTDFLSLAGSVVRLRCIARTGGGEYAGPCPWCGGRDRFHVWPAEGERGRYWCRMCGRSGDAIDFARQYFGDDFRSACARVGAWEKLEPDPRTFRSGTDHRHAPIEPSPDPTDNPLRPPGMAWQSAALAFLESCPTIDARESARALDWLRARGFTEDTLRAADIRFNPADRHVDRVAWGLDVAGKPVWLPRGIVIPWRVDGALWRINIRRAVRSGDDGPKYIGPAGSSNALYRADALCSDLSAVIVEGELDALSISQLAGDIVSAVATGSTAGARRPRWIARLALCPAVLVAFDADDAGENASRWWLDALPNAKRWRPYVHDANDMLRAAFDVRAWIAAGLEHAGMRHRRDETDAHPMVVPADGAVKNAPPVGSMDANFASEDSENLDGMGISSPRQETDADPVGISAVPAAKNASLVGTMDAISSPPLAADAQPAAHLLWPEGDVLVDAIWERPRHPGNDERAAVAWDTVVPDIEAAYDDRDLAAVRDALARYEEMASGG